MWEYKFHLQADLNVINLFEGNNFLGKENQRLEFFEDSFYDTPKRLLMKKNVWIKKRTLGSKFSVIVKTDVGTSPEGLFLRNYEGQAVYNEFKDLKTTFQYLVKNNLLEEGEEPILICTINSWRFTLTQNSNSLCYDFVEFPEGDTYAVGSIISSSSADLMAFITSKPFKPGNSIIIEYLSRYEPETLEDLRKLKIATGILSPYLCLDVVDSLIKPKLKIVAGDQEVIRKANDRNRAQYKEAEEQRAKEINLYCSID